MAYRLSEGLKATVFRAAVQQAILYRLYSIGGVVLGKIRDISLLVIT